jgi:Dihydroorotate dehydrogenase
VPLIGCGGVMSGGDADVKIRAGASLVELYSGLVRHPSHNPLFSLPLASCTALFIPTASQSYIARCRPSLLLMYTNMLIVTVTTFFERADGGSSALDSRSAHACTVWKPAEGLGAGCGGSGWVRRAWLQVYKGPELIPQMKAELLRCLQADGFASVEEAIGADHR